MTEAPFFDSNILLYTMSAGPKADVAGALIAVGGTISVQVLNEFAHVSRRKFSADFATVHHSLSVFRRLLRVDPLTVGGHQRGLALSERYRLSVFDGQILASALNANCNVLYSEDLQSGQIIEDVLTIRNPFKS
ncbi:MAG: PilT protein domain protein [Caulobacter sp.]|nr:PilT protein domain protein [Caulobacter sp.]